MAAALTLITCRGMTFTHSKINFGFSEILFSLFLTEHFLLQDVVPLLTTYLLARGFMYYAVINCPCISSVAYQMATSFSLFYLFKRKLSSDLNKL